MVSGSQAATLPVAGLTALTRYARAGCCSGARYWSMAPRVGSGISPASLLWRPARSGAMCAGRSCAAVAEWCGERVVLGRELAAAKPHGPFWLILDSLGGSALGAALGMLQPGGTCVTFGVSAAAHATFESRDFFATGGVRLYGLTLFHELMSVERAGIGLRCSPTDRGKKIRPQIAVEASVERGRHGRSSA